MYTQLSVYQILQFEYVLALFFVHLIGTPLIYSMFFSVWTHKMVWKIKRICILKVLFSAQWHSILFYTCPLLHTRTVGAYYSAESSDKILKVGKKVGKKNRTTQICMIFKLMTHFTYNEEIKVLSGKQTLLWQEFIMYWLSDKTVSCRNIKTQRKNYLTNNVTCI